jgi:hypothetical protein
LEKSAGEKVIAQDTHQGKDCLTVVYKKNVRFRLFIASIVSGEL